MPELNYRREYEPFMLNGDAHYSTLEDEPRIDRCLIFKDYIMHMITDDEPSYHLVALYRWLSARSYRIRYVGLDHELLAYLEDELEDCRIVRAPAACAARPFIEQLRYSLFVVDEVLMDTSATELTHYVRSLAHCRHTPIIIFKRSGDFERLARAVARQV